MAATFVVVPQWQGSGSTRAMRLVDGAEAIRGDLPSASTVVVDVPLEAGESQGSGVSRFSSIQLVRDRLARALSEIDGPVITIGGDCSVELAAVAHVTDTSEVALIWFDAHADLNTPATSPSSAFNGMILRTLIGDGALGLLPARPLPTNRVILAGTRSFDDAEYAYVKEAGLAVFEGDGFTTKELLAAVKASGATSIYIHIDVDVLDPSEFEGTGFPEPFGLPVLTLVEHIKALKAAFPLAGAGITEFEPSSPEHAASDLPAILRIIGALTAK
jgi:arginase